MTVIAYRDGVLAADSACNSDGVVRGFVKKTVKCADGALASASGATTDCSTFMRWCCEGRCADAKPPITDDFLGIVIEPDGTVKLYNQAMNWTEITGPFHALGAGADVAYGAMEMGASAVDAVGVAIKHSHYCAAPVQSIQLGG